MTRRKIDFSVGSWRFKGARQPADNTLLTDDGDVVADIRRSAGNIEAKSSGLGDRFVEKYPELTAKCKSCSSNIIPRMNSWNLQSGAPAGAIASIARTINSKHPEKPREVIESAIREFLAEETRIDEN